MEGEEEHAREELSEDESAQNVVEYLDVSSDSDDALPGYGIQVKAENAHNDGYNGDDTDGPLLDDANDDLIDDASPEEDLCGPGQGISNAGEKRSLPTSDDQEEIDRKSKRARTHPPESNGSEILLPLPEIHSKHSWFIENGPGMVYFGKTSNNKMHGFGRLNLGNGSQFIEGNWEMNQLVELTFCQLICDPGLKSGNQIISIIKQRNHHLLTLYDSDYIAKVTLNDINAMDFTASVAHIKNVFFEKLTVLEVVVDELKLKQKALLKKLSTLLAREVGVDADPILRANILFNLSSLENVDSLSCCASILLACDLPVDVNIVGADIVDCENRYLRDTHLFSSKLEKLRLDLTIILKKIYSDGMAQHIQAVVGKCPSALPNLMANIQSMPPSKTLYISNEDMGVFEHLVSQPSFEHYKNFFENLADRYFLTVNFIEEGTRPSRVSPVMSPIYGFLIKSLWEIILEIVHVVGYDYEDMLKCEPSNWKLKELIEWPQSEESDTQTTKFMKMLNSSEKTTLHHRSLEIQYYTLFQLMKHFSPENSIVKKESNEFEFHVLEQDLSWWEKGMSMSENEGELVNRLKKLSCERLAWLYFLDHTIYKVFLGDPKYQILLKPYNSLLQGLVSFVENSTTESYETFRVMTHSILKFITSTAPYFGEAHEKPGVDVEILVQQTWTFSAAAQEMENDPSASSNFRDLIAEYNRYLSLRLSINIEATSGHFSTQISEMMQTFMRIVVTSLKKSVPTTALVAYMRSLNEFLEDFKSIDFLAMWFVKRQRFESDILEKVNNKLSAGGNCSYRVIDTQKCVQIMQILGNVPDHYIILVVSKLLECIELCLQKEWRSDGMALQVTQLESTGLLLDAIRKSFLYLKEQPDYVDFETFKTDSVEPFVRLVNNCTTLNEMKLRTGMVGESLWYLRKMDEIGIEEALKSFRNINTANVSNQLLACYNLYLGYYNNHIAHYKSLLSGGKSHEKSLNEVIQTLDKSNVHFSMWTEEFKIKKIPVMLGIFSAVWSIMVSKDISSSGKFLKPHCIQILCILRLLSVDRSIGANNHLAQVLTGQGKSLILCLLSSILAATGHDVKILCYSYYLSTRDQNNSDDFFKSFQLANKIHYGTFENMADDFLCPVSNGQNKSLRHLVMDRVLNHSEWSVTGGVTRISKNTVLLIDEIDVFFSEKFYSNSYCPCISPRFEALAKVQEMIWTWAAAQKYSKKQIEEMAIIYIHQRVSVRDMAFLEFNAFLTKPGTITLLTYINSRLCVAPYTNRTVFHEQLVKMVDGAVTVASPLSIHDAARTGYIIDSEGIICFMGIDSSVYSRGYLNSYLNMFNYFRIKKLNFDSKSLRNYGYLILKVGEISYARIPSQFKLILGVSGTLTNLREWEKTAIKSYNIHDFSVLPSFFGESNLKFDQVVDFHYFNKENDWMKETYNRANKTVDLKRAVIIFFHSDITMNLFKKAYKNKFDRLNEITEYTNAILRDTFIDESGMPCTVTLATRGMGRGVDYKSSLTVEKNGGVHVIQTFFSVDVKEEAQIQGRTARKDNKGSYELMICREHLVKDSIIRKDDSYPHNYHSLATIRKELSEQKGKEVNRVIAVRERNHVTTMQYFGLMHGSPPVAQTTDSHQPLQPQQNQIRPPPP